MLYIQYCLHVIILYFNTFLIYCLQTRKTTNVILTNFFPRESLTLGLECSMILHLPDCGVLSGEGRLRSAVLKQIEAL